MSNLCSTVILIRAEDGFTPVQQRRCCLEELVRQAKRLQPSRVMIEQDDSSLSFDKRVMFEAAQRFRLGPEFSYGWQRPRIEPLLWVADGFAWAWARGGRWRAGVLESVTFLSAGSP